MTLYDCLSHLCAVAGIAAFLYQLPELARRRNDAAVWALSGYFLASGLSFLIDLNEIRNHIATFLGHPNITTVVTQSAVVVLTGAQQVVLIHWSKPPHEARALAKRCVYFFIGTLMTLVALFFLIDPYRASVSAENSLLLNMGDPGYALYLLFYVTVCAVGQVATLHMAYRHTRVTHRYWLRVGMLAITIGAAFILVYCLIRYTQTIGTQLGYNMRRLEPAYWLAGSAGSLLQLFGWTVPAWGRTVSLWIANYHAYLRLSPLWWAMYRVVPTIALEPPRSPWLDVLLPRGLRFRLYRRVIEILDGYLELRPQLSLAVQQCSAPEAESNSPDREARLLHTALQARANGYGSVQFSGVVSGNVATKPGMNFSDEVKRLTRVAVAFARITADERGSARRV